MDMGACLSPEFAKASLLLTALQKIRMLLHLHTSAGNTTTSPYWNTTHKVSQHLCSFLASAGDGPNLLKTPMASVICFCKNLRAYRTLNKGLVTHFPASAINSILNLLILPSTVKRGSNSKGCRQEQTVTQRRSLPNTILCYKNAREPFNYDLCVTKALEHTLVRVLDPSPAAALAWRAVHPWRKQLLSVSALPIPFPVRSQHCFRCARNVLVSGDVQCLLTKLSASAQTPPVDQVWGMQPRVNQLSPKSS